ncbi:MAG: gliding motility-associated C-terminal domain-containing protein [Cyclobacteriaceae bacterium]|nr:gliding motility-associated C-terminal domain-containing protein [Cyclobacteriaceae bacterium]
MSRFICLVSFLLLSFTGYTQISSTFNANAQGWTTPDDADGTIGYSATGGNPGGFVFGTPFSIVLGATTLYIPFHFTAPVAYLGNRSAYYNGTLRYDIQQSSTAASAQNAEVIIADNGGVTLYYFPATPNQPPAAPGWATYSVVFNNTSGFWKTTNSATGAAAAETQIQSILSDLASLQIRGLYRNANVTGRLDNVTFTPPIIINTQPAASTFACRGTPVSLTTAASGNPAIGYQWQILISGVYINLANGGNYSGVTTNTLNINTTDGTATGNYRCTISGTNVENANTNNATVIIGTIPDAPTTTGASSCSPAALTLTASGLINGQYRWYNVPVGGTVLSTSATYTTPVLSATTTYYVVIFDGSCESTRTPVTATIHTPPAAPATTSASRCGTGTVTLTASGGSAGQYRWYTVPTGGIAIAGQTNATYITPSLTVTTPYYVAINNGTCESTRTLVTATINTPPNAPATTGNSLCGSGTVALTATGGTAGQYRWYTVPTGGTAIAGQTNASYTTPVITTTTTYYVAINNGTCESTRTPVIATINTLPNAPGVTGSESCNPASLTLTATGGSAGQYRWYTVPTGGTAIAGQTNASYTTPVLTVTTTYYVAVNNGTCESARTPVVAAIAPPSCSNEPPVVNVVPIVTKIGGIVTLNLADLITDPDNNLDLSSLSIVSPPAHAASSFIDGDYNLVIDYTGIPFSGIDSVAIRVCDIYTCVVERFGINVIGEIIIYNAVSPNNDGQNDSFRIEHITALDETHENKVSIFNRWGDLVWEGTNYDNDQVVFTGTSKSGADLPSGTYFYKIEFKGGHKTESGYLVLKR